MSDHIVVSGLRVATKVGWTEEERATPQVVLIDLDVETDFGASSTSDDLAHTVDYAGVIAEIANHVQSGETRLLERLATEIAEIVSAKDGVKRVSVGVSKEVVPVPEEVGRVTVRTTRSN